MIFFFVRTLAAGRVRVFDRVLPSASTQTYSAKTLSLGKARLPYLAMTAGSKADCPVTLFKIPDMCRAEDPCR